MEQLNQGHKVIYGYMVFRWISPVPFLKAISSERKLSGLIE
jgi:hypothetical protein